MGCSIESILHVTVQQATCGLSPLLIPGSGLFSFCSRGTKKYRPRGRYQKQNSRYAKDTSWSRLRGQRDKATILIFMSLGDKNHLGIEQAEPGPHRHIAIWNIVVFVIDSKISPTNKNDLIAPPIRSVQIRQRSSIFTRRGKYVCQKDRGGW